LGLETIGKWLVWAIWRCIYKLLYFTAVCIYTTKRSTPAISLFFLGPNPVVVYICGVPNTDTNVEKLQIVPDWMEDWHVQGNNKAVEMAGIAAVSHRLPLATAKASTRTKKKLDLIQKISLAVTKLLPQRKPNKTMIDNIEI